MANILSELERFEQEMKELVSDSQSPPSPSPAGDSLSNSALPASSSEPSVLTGMPSSTSGTGVQSIAQVQQSSKPRAPPTSVGTSSFVPVKSSPVIASSAHLQSQPSTVPTSVGLSVPAAPHLQWLSSAAVSAPAPSAPAPPVSASTSSQFTYSGVAYPPASVTATSSAPYFPLPFHLQRQPDHLQQQQQPEQQYPQQQQYLMPQYQPQVQKQYPLVSQPQQPVAIQAPQYQYSSLYPASAPVGGIYSLPQQQQAQQLFQKDAQTITPEALENVKAALASSESEHKAETKKKAVPRKVAGQSWEDPTLADWPENDFRLFCGDLGNEVNDEVLTKAFSRYASFIMARVVRDKRTGKTRGYGFVSFSNPSDLALALKEMNGKYVGNRPIKLRKSNWKERIDYEAWEKQKMQGQKKGKFSKKNFLHK
jgi:hypothetical protein